MPAINYAVALDELADEISNVAEGKGFWDYDTVGDDGLIPLKLVLIASEVSEALDVHRNIYDDSEVDSSTGMTAMQETDFTEELADVVIRVLDLAGYFDLDIGASIIEKMEKNQGRPHRHSKRY